MPAITIYLTTIEFKQLMDTASTDHMKATELAQKFVRDGLKREGVIE